MVNENPEEVRRCKAIDRASTCMASIGRSMASEGKEPAGKGLKGERAEGWVARVSKRLKLWHDTGPLVFDGRPEPGVVGIFGLNAHQSPCR
jgi:hypothetical protein